MSDILEQLYAVPETGADPELIKAAAECIEELQTELNEQARLLGMSAEREMALNSKIQHLINVRNALGLAIDRALAGIVPDEHPLRSRLVEIAAMRAEIEAMRKQEPVAWRTFDGEGGYDYRTFGEHPQYRDEFLKRNGEKYADWVEPLYLAPGAQTAPSVPDENAAFEAWFRSEQGTPYDGMWSFARAAWMARAKLAPGAQENNDG